MKKKNIILLDNATLRSALTALGCLPFENDSKEAMYHFDLHLLGASVLIDSLLLHDHIFVPNIHGEDYPPTLEIATKLLGHDIFSVIELHPKEKDAVYELAVADLVKWPIVTPRIIAHLDHAIGLDGFNEKSWDNIIHKAYSSRLISHYFSYDKLTRIYTGGESNIPRQFLEYLQGHINQPSNLTSFPETIDTQSSDEVINKTVLWLAFRTCVYDIISRLRNIIYEPYPARSELWKFINLRRSPSSGLFNLPSETLLESRKNIAGKINKSLGMQEYQVSIPPFLAFVLSLAEKPEDIFPIVLELRHDRKVVALRENISTIISEINTGSTKNVMKLCKDYESLSIQLTTEYFGNQPPSIPFSIQITNIGFGYDIAVPVGIYSKINDLMALGKPHLAFLRDVYKSVVDIWKFSDLYDSLFYKRSKVIRSVIRQQMEYPSVEHLKEKAVSYLKKNGNSVSFVIFDLKDFDTVNLKYGREGGDKVIKLFTDILSKFPGRKTMVTRSAGDSFVILLLGVQGKEARDWAKIIHDELTSYAFELDIKSQANPAKEVLHSDVHIAISTTDKVSDIDNCFFRAVQQLKADNT